MYFLLGVAVLILSLYAGRAFLRADPKNLSTTVRRIGGVIVLVVAVLLLLRGALFAAIPLGMLGFGLLGRPLNLPGFGTLGGGRTPGQQSRVRTERLDMILDHDSGRMDGKVLLGQFAGKLLSELPLAQLMEIWRECRAQDVQSARLLEAYLDRAAPDWRDAAGQSGASGRGSGAAPTNGRMTPDEAYEVLGLSPGAGAPEVRRAHRELMKKLHPDRGGSTYLAAKINQAKDVLLSARR